MLLHPSQAEGFGLPIAEAMAAGCPAVVSDLPVMREIGGDAAVYCTGHCIEHWTEIVLGLLQQRDRGGEDWSALRQASRQNAGRFQWSVHARQVANLYLETFETLPCAR